MKKIRHGTNRGQGVLLVLYALRELGGVRSKREVIDFIQAADFYEVTAHDLPPYDGQNEPKYHTLLAWARKDALENGWLVDTTKKDEWLLSREGREIIDQNIPRYQTGRFNVRDCYLWTAKFKKLIDPSYEASPSDKKRPQEYPIDYI